LALHAEVLDFLAFWRGDGVLKRMVMLLILPAEVRGDEFRNVYMKLTGAKEKRAIRV
jgi:hypothetical protein